jgi:hypothetical protein
MIRTERGQRHVSPGEVNAVAAHRHEDDRAYMTLILNTGEHATASVDDLERLVMIRHGLDHPPEVA